MVDTHPRLAAVPRRPTATGRNACAPNPRNISNLLWLRINKALAVVQCIAQQEPTDNPLDAAQTDALAGAAVDLLELALADCNTLETCMH